MNTNHNSSCLRGFWQAGTTKKDEFLSSASSTAPVSCERVCSGQARDEKNNYNTTDRSDIRTWKLWKVFWLAKSNDVGWPLLTHRKHLGQQVNFLHVITLADWEWLKAETSCSDSLSSYYILTITSCLIVRWRRWYHLTLWMRVRYVNAWAYGFMAYGLPDSPKTTSLSIIGTGLSSKPLCLFMQIKKPPRWTESIIHHTMKPCCLSFFPYVNKNFIAPYQSWISIGLLDYKWLTGRSHAVMDSLMIWWHTAWIYLRIMGFCIASRFFTVVVSQKKESSSEGFGLE